MRYCLKYCRSMWGGLPPDVVRHILFARRQAWLQDALDKRPQGQPDLDHCEVTVCFGDDKGLTYHWNNDMFEWASMCGGPSSTIFTLDGSLNGTWYWSVDT